MKVEVLYFRGCPNHEPAVALVAEIARTLGEQLEIREVEVRHESDAARLRFLGSPTVRVDGIDVERARRTDEQYAMSCRMYGSSGIPPREMIVSALSERAT